MLAGALTPRLINCERGMWGDEITTSWVSQLPPARIVEERLVHSHLPTYFLGMHLWATAVGATTLVLGRSSIVPGALAVWAFSWSARAGSRFGCLFCDSHQGNPRLCRGDSQSLT
jgi:hypothetical protein